MVEAIGECSEAIAGYGFEEGVQNPFSEKVDAVVKNKDVADKLFFKLSQLDLVHFEKKLGNGAFGSVFQVDGKGAFSGKKVAVKLFSFSESNTVATHGYEGEALALSLPQNCHLGRPFGVLTYDGKSVHYVEKYDPQVHGKQVLIGTVSHAIKGCTLHDKMKERTFSVEEVRGYGKQLAEAILGLHQFGFAHKDIHAENILLKDAAPEKPPYRLKVIDFSLMNDASAKRIRNDWKKFAYLISEMGGEELIFDTHFYDLIYSEKHGLLNGHQPYSEKEVLSHPFFK